jgi:cyclomaltodextrinase
MFNQSFLPNVFLGNHDVTRIATVLKDERHLGHAVAVLLTVPGTPSIYYGDEQAFKAVKEKRSGGDDAIRPAFPPTPEEFALPNWHVYQLYRELIELRHSNVWISSGLIKSITLANQFFVYETAYGAQCLQVALNVGDAPGHLAVSQNSHVLKAGTAYKSGNDWQIPAHAFAIFAP